MKKKHENTRHKKQKLSLNEWKQLGKKILFPYILIKLILVIISAVAMYYAFGTENPNLVISCAGYAISAYTVVVVCQELEFIIW